MVTNKTHLAQRQFLSGTWELLSAAPWMMLLALLTAPAPPSRPEITSMGEADKETGL